MDAIERQRAADALIGGGVMGTRVRSFDWAQTPIGAMEYWPQSLLDNVQTLLELPFPGILIWGTGYTVCAYNDPYIPLLGAKQEALGRQFLEVGAEAHDIIAPLLEKAFRGKASSFREAKFTLLRRNTTEHVYFDYSFSPVRDESGKVMGVLNIAQEVTARKRAEDALRETEQRFRTLVQASSDAVYRMGADWTEMRHLVGRDFVPDTVEPSQSWLEKYIPPEDQAEVMKAIDQAIRTKGVFELEHRVRRVDGDLGWAFSRAIPILDANGEITEWIGMVSNITESRRIEGVLRQNSERQTFLLKLGDALRPLANPVELQRTAMKLLAEQLDVMRATYFEVDADQDSFVRTAGYEKDAVPIPDRMRLSDFAPEISDAYRAGRTLVFRDTEAETQLGSRPEAHRSIGIRAWATVPLIKNGELVALVGIQSRMPRDWSDGELRLLEDVAELTWAAAERARVEEALRQNEEQLSAVLGNLPVGVWIVDAKGRVISKNKAADQIWAGDAPLSSHTKDYVEYAAWDVKTGKRLDADDYPLARSLQTGLPVNSIELRIRRFDGTEGFITMSTVPIRNQDGLLTGAVGINMDITERKKAEEQLLELNETLEQRVAERTQEVRRQADQLRALASRLGLIEQIERKRLAKILHDHIQQLIVAAHMQVESLKFDTNPERLEANAQAVESILNEALETSRSLTVELSPPVLHETGLFGGLNWLVTRMQKQHRFSVRLHADTEAEPPDEQTRFLLFECVRELLLNAVKHAGVREADVTLLRPGAGKIRVIVHDGGKGFDPDLLKKRQAEEVSFGLFSIQERLAYLGGRMEIESAPGKGTRVTLTVPVIEENGVTAEPEKAETRTVPPIRHKAGMCRVLIVDDHQIVREGLARLLEAESDIEVIGQAADGPEAIALAGKLEPDIVLMDINLGEMDGIEATRRLLAANPEVKVIGLSLHADKSVADAMRKAGAVSYVTKGGASENLIKAIRKCHSVGSPGHWVSSGA
ncbi:MAG: PAS domain-containing protein [Desulfobacterales bacterium]